MRFVTETGAPPCIENTKVAAFPLASVTADASRRPASMPHSCVDRLSVPEVSASSTHEAARRQLKGFGTIISFDVLGDAAVADAVCARLQLIQHATSLGAVESTIERRAGIPGQEHLPPALLRLSVGIEGVEDLWADLDRALRAIP